MSPETVAVPGTETSKLRAGFDLFLISLIILFLELACIRWFPAHVLFLTFFTNMVLLACFLGMSVGCLAASWSRNFLAWTPILLAAGLACGHGVELIRYRLEQFLDVGQQRSPEFVYFGTEYRAGGVDDFKIPIEVLGGSFFLLITLAMVGPGQELGRAFNRLPNRVAAYTVNILGSIVGIVLFAGFSWFELSPFWWFLPAAVGLAYFLIAHRLVKPGFEMFTQVIFLGAILLMASLTSGKFPIRAALGEWVSFMQRENDSIVGEHLWSSYYRVDYNYNQKLIDVNLIGHQQMIRLESRYSAYALPYLLNRDAKGPPWKEVLIIGAGSGNDVARALQWGADHVDAVEIDPRIQKLGAEYHPNKPYQDPRVTVYYDDGRNFLRSTNKKYDLVIYALVDSLVLHSSYSSLRLEFYLFTTEAFADVKRHLKPDGTFVMYNFFRQGWIVARLQSMLQSVFQSDPLLLTLPYLDTIKPEESFPGGFTLLFSGNTMHIKEAFQKNPAYWLRSDEAPGPDSPDGLNPGLQPEFMNVFGPQDLLGNLAAQTSVVEGWHRYGLATVEKSKEPLRLATDDWPFLYLKRPIIPMQPNLSGMAVMAGLALVLILMFLPGRKDAAGSRFAFSGRMFFLGAGFMLIESKAVVRMALLFGSTWQVNTVVFFAILVMILLANLFVLLTRPQKLWPYYVGLFASLVVYSLVPLHYFLGMDKTMQVVGSCLLVFTPVLFAGVIFAVSFSRGTEPARDLGANIAGAITGGLAENVSMIIGFQYLILVALGFYVLSSLFRSRLPAPAA